MITVQTTKDIDVEQLISELDTKSKKRGVEGKMYAVEVNKQLLANARDALMYFNAKVAEYERSKEN